MFLFNILVLEYDYRKSFVKGAHETQVSSCEYCKIVKNIYFEKHLQTLLLWGGYWTIKNRLLFDYIQYLLMIWNLMNMFALSNIYDEKSFSLWQWFQYFLFGFHAKPNLGYVTLCFLKNRAWETEPKVWFSCELVKKCC